MVKASRSVYGKKFSQESLPLDLRNIICGQPIFLYGLTHLVLLGVIILSGFFAGLFGAYGSRIAFTDPPALSLTLLLVLLIVSFTWIWNCAYRGFTNSLWKSFLIALILTFLAAIALQNPIFIGLSLLFNLLALGSVSLAFLCCVFSLFLVDGLSRRQTIFAKKVIAIAVIIISILVSYQIGQDFPEKSSFSQDYYVPAKLLLGISVGSIVALAGRTVAQAKGKSEQNFKFLRLWAIALAAWGGTSFYDLNLSGVDFSGANLANSDFRARELYKSILKGVTGLELARVDSRYLDLENPKVQELLTHGVSSDQNFKGINLKGAYLYKADLRGYDFTNANLIGADLSRTDLRHGCFIQTHAAGVAFKSADLRACLLIDANLTESDFRDTDLRGSILVRAQVARVNFTGADLTGICIEDWSVSSKTQFTDVRCDYIYRKYQDGEPRDRYPVDRNFEPGEFASLFAEPEDEVELVFKGEFNIAALSLALYKLQTDAPELNLELRGVEQREKLWVAKIKSTSSLLNERLIEERLTSVYQDPSSGNITVEKTIKNSIYRDYEETKHRLAESELLVKQLAGVTGNQAEALKELSKQSFGNSFFITGSTITNLAGSGQIEYHEAADQVRSLVTNSADPSQVIPILRSLIMQLSEQKVATTSGTQLEFIQQLIVAEAEKDQAFRQFLTQHEAQIISAMPSGAIATAIQSAIHTVNSKLP